MRQRDDTEGSSGKKETPLSGRRANDTIVGVVKEIYLNMLFCQERISVHLYVISG